MRVHFEFLNGVDDGRDRVRVALCTIVVNAVNHEIIAAVGLAVHRWKCETGTRGYRRPASAAVLRHADGRDSRSERE